MNISLEKLLEVGAHFGHQTKRWNPKMEHFVYGVREGVYIFDLIKSRKYIEEALKVISTAKSEGKLIMLVGTKKQAKKAVREIGEETGICFVDERWLGGTLTNFEQIRDSVKTLERLKKEMEEGKFNSYTKKERLLLTRQIEKLERNVGGIKNLDRNPDLMIVIDTRRERSAIAEAVRSGVDIVGVIDTNGDPTHIDHPIPMNDDSPLAIEYILSLIKEALLVKKQVKKPKTKSKKKSS